MNWVRNILRLVCALVVCWGIVIVAAAAPLFTRLDSKKYDLQVLAPERHSHVKTTWLGFTHESLWLTSQTGFPARPIQGVQRINDLKLLPKSFRSEFERREKTDDPVEWLMKSHMFYAAGWPMRSWTAHDSFDNRKWTPTSGVSWDGGVPMRLHGWRFRAPIRPLPIPFAINMAFWYCAIWGVEWLVIHSRRWRRERKGVCVTCAYPKPEGATVCPECGTPIDAV